MMRSEATTTPNPGAIAEQISRDILADVAAGRVPPRPWDGSADVEGTDPLIEAASYPGYYGDIAALEAENRALRQAEGVLP